MDGEWRAADGVAGKELHIARTSNLRLPRQRPALPNAAPVMGPTSGRLQSGAELGGGAFALPVNALTAAVQSFADIEGA